MSVAAGKNRWTCVKTANTGAINAYMDIGTYKEALKRNPTFEIACITTVFPCANYSSLPVNSLVLLVQS